MIYIFVAVISKNVYVNWTNNLNRLHVIVKNLFPLPPKKRKYNNTIFKGIVQERIKISNQIITIWS